MANYSKSGAGYDLTFELNEFEEPRIRSDIETVKNTLLFILFSKPGQYPSLPQIGLNIQSYLYSNYDTLDVNDLRTRIVSQCAALGVYFNNGTIAIKKVMYHNEPSLLIQLEGSEEFPPAYKVPNKASKRYLIGLTYDDMKNMIYNVNAS